MLSAEQFSAIVNAIRKSFYLCEDLEFTVEVNPGTVTESNPLAGTIKVKLNDKPDMAPVLFKRDEVTLISRPSKKDND